MTLAEFSDIWIQDYAESHLAESTLKSYNTRIKQRIIPALGHLKISKIQPHHLIEFYKNISEESIRLDTYYEPSKKVVELLNANISLNTATDIGLSAKTYIRLRQGEKTNLETAEKVCKYYGLSFGHNFKVVSKDKKLSGKTVKHHLRHTNASLLISEGTDIVTLSGRLEIGRASCRERV